MRKRKARDAGVEMGTGNVYADLAYGDANEVLIKAQLVAKIAEIIKRKGITQTQAAALLQMPQPKLFNLLTGWFRGVSERRLMDCLTKLGRDVQIVVKARLVSGRAAGCRSSAPDELDTTNRWRSKLPV
jgi:predicted XRE-type DNA-binding protein